jgi:diguanylate cyclase (GGDEF)-like protein
MEKQPTIERRQRGRADRRSGSDPLTGLFNRQYLTEALEKDCRRARRYGTPLSCLMLDIDGFKELNDKYGHTEGDAILRQVAGAITYSVRDIDTPARYGGDEFCILLPETGLEGAMLLGERLRAAVAAMEIVIGKRSMTVTASVGVFSPATMNQFRPTTLIDYAETALRKAKLTGNQVCAHSTPGVSVA